MKKPVARCKFANIWLCSHGSVKTLCRQEFGRMAGSDVDANLIGGHIMKFANVSQLPTGSDVDANLIGGHSREPSLWKIQFGIRRRR